MLGDAARFRFPGPARSLWLDHRHGVAASDRVGFDPFPRRGEQFGAVQLFPGHYRQPADPDVFPVNDREGKPKDTARNVEATGEFVVNLVSFDLRGPMNESASSLPYEESEFEKFAIESAPSVRVKPPRVAAAPVAFECRLHMVVPIGAGPLAARVIFGRILMMHVADHVLGPEGKPDPAKLDLIARLGGEGYARTTDRFSLKRPD